MKIYCKYSDMAYTDAMTPEGIRVVGHVVDVSKEVAESLCIRPNAIFSFDPWSAEDCEQTEYDPGAGGLVNDYVDNLPPPANVTATPLPPPASEPAEPTN